jgi:hypothetical protein
MEIKCRVDCTHQRGGFVDELTYHRIKQGEMLCWSRETKTRYMMTLRLRLTFLHIVHISSNVCRSLVYFLLKNDKYLETGGKIYNIEKLNTHALLHAWYSSKQKQQQWHCKMDFLKEIYSIILKHMYAMQ